MALILADRVRETSTTTGTGTLTLDGAVTSYQSFAAVGNANTTYYTIVNQNAAEWEVGIGTYTSSGTTLARTTVLSSSNAGSLVNFSAGTKDVWGDYPAGKAVTTDTLASPPAIGTTTPAAGAFTTLSASSTVSGAGFDTYLASPPAIGGTTAAAGTFTTLTSPTLKSLTGSVTTGISLETPLGAQATIIDIGDGTRPLRINGGSAGATSSAGISSSVGVLQLSATTSNISFYTGGRASTEQFRVFHTASAVNYVQATGAITGGNPSIVSAGSDGAINLSLSSKSTSSVYFYTNNLSANSRHLDITHTGSVVNRFQITGSQTGTPVVLGVNGNDADIDVAFTPKGAGTVRFGTYTVSALLAVAGYITIKDSGGTTRRLLVG